MCVVTLEVPEGSGVATSFSRFANSPVLKHLEEEGKLAVIEAVYKLDSGEVVRLGKPASAAH